RIRASTSAATAAGSGFSVEAGAAQAGTGKDARESAATAASRSPWAGRLVRMESSAKSGAEGDGAAFTGHSIQPQWYRQVSPRGPNSVPSLDYPPPNQVNPSQPVPACGAEPSHLLLLIHSDNC